MLEDGALRQIEAEFDQTLHEGRVTLQRTPGPVAIALPPSATPVSESA